MAQIVLDKERIEQIVSEAVYHGDNKDSNEFNDSFEEWLYYTIAVEVTRLRGQLLAEEVARLKKRFT